MGKIFVLNAPKQCGKDTAANVLAGNFGFEKAGFKDPMFDMLAASLGMSDAFGHVMELYETQGWKDTPNNRLGGKTPRDMMIHISENFFKPFFGPDIFGQRLAEGIMNTEEMFGEVSWVISDCGFDAEVKALNEQFPDRVVIVQFEREGFRDFGDDSRDWVNIQDIPTYKMDTTHTGTDGLVQLILSLNKAV